VAAINFLFRMTKIKKKKKFFSFFGKKFIWNSWTGKLFISLKLNFVLISFLWAKRIFQMVFLTAEVKIVRQK
jgi:hypothetical protein